MKKLIILSTILLTGIVYVACSKHDAIYFADLPAEAQAFLLKYFPDNLVAKAEQHDEEPRYEVILDNGYEIDFYGDGRWQEIDSRHAILPAELIQGVLPEKIRNFLEQEYPLAGVSAIERSAAGYNIELAATPSIELYFDPVGNVMTDWGDD
ncbi:MAG: PepSY-like domain-containing protein [Bacteroidaceae bacterium]|nr:PepSY-like domain-containing protein [Bacteroidaceae bacterium]MBR6749560.1 PepSY-like domain-containing protein [Bacteroidaceae bacterium]